MKTATVVQSRFIDGSDARQASIEFNQAMMELAYLNPTFERNGNDFWIFYKVEKSEAESITEEHEEAGEKAHCEDCPFFARDLNRYGNIDARKKWGTCSKQGTREHAESSACDIYHSLRERRRF